MTWLMVELWGLFLAAAALGAVGGYTLRSWLGAGESVQVSKAASRQQTSKKKGVVEGKVIHTTAADVVSDETQGSSYPVEQIEGVGKTYAKKLRSIGVRQTHDLLDLCRDNEGRDRLAKYLKVHTNEVKRWTVMADLMRINGVGGQYAELLEASEISSIEDFMKQKPEALAKQLSSVNKKTHKTKTSPDAARLKEWMQNAKGMTSSVNG